MLAHKKCVKCFFFVSDTFLTIKWNFSYRMEPDEQGRFGFNVQVRHFEISEGGQFFMPSANSLSVSQGGADINLPVIVSKIARGMPVRNESCLKSLWKFSFTLHYVWLWQTKINKLSCVSRLTCACPSYRKEMKLFTSMEGLSKTCRIMKWVFNLLVARKGIRFS